MASVLSRLNIFDYDATSADQPFSVMYPETIDTFDQTLNHLQSLPPQAGVRRDYALAAAFYSKALNKSDGESFRDLPAGKCYPELVAALAAEIPRDKNGELTTRIKFLDACLSRSYAFADAFNDENPELFQRFMGAVYNALDSQGAENLKTRMTGAFPSIQLNPWQRWKNRTQLHDRVTQSHQEWTCKNQAAPDPSPE